MLDPTSEQDTISRKRVVRPAAIADKRIGLLDISVERSDVFLDRLELLLSERGARVERFRKPSHTRPAPRSLIEEIVRHADMVVVALAG